MSLNISDWIFACVCFDSAQRHKAAQRAALGGRSAWRGARHDLGFRALQEAPVRPHVLLEAIGRHGHRRLDRPGDAERREDDLRRRRVLARMRLSLRAVGRQAPVRRSPQAAGQHFVWVVCFILLVFIKSFACVVISFVLVFLLIRKTSKIKPDMIVTMSRKDIDDDDVVGWENSESFVPAWAERSRGSWADDCLSCAYVSRSARLY